MFTRQGSFEYVHSSRESKLRSFAADLDEFAALVARLGRRAAAVSGEIKIVGRKLLRALVVRVSAKEC